MDSRKACYVGGVRYLSRDHDKSHDSTYVCDQEGAGVRENELLIRLTKGVQFDFEVISIAFETYNPSYSSNYTKP
jgi:hypothetical protein